MKFKDRSSCDVSSLLPAGPSGIRAGWVIVSWSPSLRWFSAKVIPVLQCWVYYSALEAPQKVNDDWIKHFLGISYAWVYFCMTPHYKRTLFYILSRWGVNKSLYVHLRVIWDLSTRSSSFAPNFFIKFDWLNYCNGMSTCLGIFYANRSADSCVYIYIFVIVIS